MWGGVWRDSIGRVCQGDAWADVWPMKKYLYKSGDECTAMTGGWSAVRVAFGQYGVFGTVSKLGDCIRVTGTSIDATTGICTNQKVPISSYSALYARVKKAQKGADYNGSQYNSNVSIACLRARLTGDYRINYGESISDPVGDAAGTHETGIEVILCVDISEIDIDTYIFISGYGVKEYYVYEIWLER